MASLPPYRTRKGLEFGLNWNPVPWPDTAAPHWRYVIDVRLPTGMGKAYTVLIRKASYATQAEADAFLLADPLTELQERLEDADENGIPLTWSSPLDDWHMY